MDSSKVARSKLLSLFSAGTIPTQEDFALLIDSQLNAVDDQVERVSTRSKGDSLGVGAGTQGGLLSFYSDLRNPNANWDIRLDKTDGALEVHSSQTASPVLCLQPDGKIGMNMSKPTVELEVNGDIQANNLTASSTVTTQNLQVLGAASFSIIYLNGKKLDGSASGEKAAPVPVFTPEPTGPLPTNQTAATDPNPPISKTVAATGDWITLAQSTQFIQMYEVNALYQDGENMALANAVAVNVLGDASRSAVTLTQSYDGHTFAKLKFRWHKLSKTEFALQINTHGVPNSAKGQIVYSYKNTLPDVLKQAVAAST